MDFHNDFTGRHQQTRYLMVMIIIYMEISKIYSEPILMIIILEEEEADEHHPDDDNHQ